MVGSGSEEQCRRLWLSIEEEADEDDWSSDERRLLQRLLRRLVMEGKLYADLAPEERYYLTQLLVDLFDLFVESESLTGDIPLRRLQQLAEGFPAGGKGRRLLRYLVRGRELNGDAVIWGSGTAEEHLAYLGYLTPTETQALAACEPPRSPGEPGGRGAGIWRAVQGAARVCSETGRELVGFVG
jgi:hypothetical protein